MLWKTIDQCSIYEVSNTGSVRNIRTGYVLKLKSHNGYMIAPMKDTSRKNAKGKYPSKHRFVHILVLNAFIGKKLNKKYETHHKDGNRGNNELTNLEWVLIKEHRLAHYETRQRLFNGKLTGLNEEKVLDIRSSELTNTQLSLRYSISYYAIWMARNYKTWKWVK